MYAMTHISSNKPCSFIILLFDWVYSISWMLNRIHVFLCKVRNFLINILIWFFWFVFNSSEHWTPSFLGFKQQIMNKLSALTNWFKGNRISKWTLNEANCVSHFEPNHSRTVGDSLFYPSVWNIRIAWNVCF